MDDRSVRTPVGRLRAPLGRRYWRRSRNDSGRSWLGSGIAAEGNGLGLIGMREPVMALGGQLDVIDLVDKGFRLHAMIPFEAPVGLLQ
jgi:signal transduction histidine kinase